MAIVSSPSVQKLLADPARRRVAEAALIVLLALTLNLAGNGRTSLWDRDEPRYAGCTREMKARGDWLRPTFNGEPRYHKPVLIYWLMRAGYAVGGDNEFGARLVSAVAGASTCLLVLVMGRRLVGDRAGFLAALMLTTAPIMVVESKLATTDATLALFLVGSQFALWELSRRESRAWAAAFWVLLALATLTKGPVGPALIACAGAVSWWWGGPTSVWKRLHWKWGVPLFLLVAAPWYVAIGVISHGDFYRFAVGKQIAERVTTGMEQHGGFPGYYVVTSLAMFHPWSALVPAAALAAWARRRVDPRFGFLLGWVVGPLVLLECVKTKMVHYYLPAYPAAALLGAWLVCEIEAEGVNVRRWPLGRAAVGLLGGVGIGIATTLVAAGFVLPAGLRVPCLVTACVVTAGTLWGLLRLQHAATSRAVGGLAATWALVMLCVGGWLLPAAEPYRLTRIVGEKLARVSEAKHLEPVLLSFQEPTVVFTMGRSATLIRTWDTFYEMLDRHGELVTVLIPIEEAEFRKRSDHIELEEFETIQGFNMNKAEVQALKLARIRRKPGTGLAAQTTAVEKFRIQ
ncbi:MAG: glycosyltransferase family 39 protein [Isosphaeraceae bacterium]